jgi:hypothetical protein
MNQDNSNKTPANLKGVRKALDRSLEIPRIIVIDSCTRIQRSWFEHQPKEVDCAVEIRQKTKLLSILGGSAMAEAKILYCNYCQI